MLSKVSRPRLWGLLAAIMVVALVAAACGGGDEPTPIVVEKEVIKEVPVPVERVVEVEKPVIVEKEVPVEVIKEVPVEVIKEVVKEVPVERVVVREVVKEVEVAPPPPPKETIVFADLNWDSAQVQNGIARYIVEYGYGYPTEAIFGGTIPLWTGLLNGDIQVNMEVWLPNQQDMWDAAMEKAQVIPVGKSLDDNWQSAFVVPTYVIQGDPDRGIEPMAPDLKTPQDIRQYQSLFASAESAGKAVLVSCIASWRCSEINEAKVTAYGLNDVIQLQDPGSAAALFASLEGAYLKGNPWLGYLWGPTKPAAELDLTVLEEAACGVGQLPDDGCAYPSAQVRIAVHPSLVSRAPDVIEFLRKWDFTAATQVTAETYMADTGASYHETGIWYLENQESVWTQWVSEEVAQNVKDALAAGKKLGE